MVAMAQTVPVLMGGLDLSVGAVMTHGQLRRQHVLVRQPAGRSSLRHRSLPAVGSARRPRQRLRRGLRPHPADHRHAGDRRHLHRHRPVPAADPGRQGRRGPVLGDDQRPQRVRRHLRLARRRRRRLVPAHRLAAGPAVVVASWWCCSSGCRSAPRSPAAASTRSARPRGRPTCPACAIERSKLAAFTLAGFFAGVGGLYLALQTSSGNADVPQAGAYTLNSIAAVVIGGTSLMGGSGGAIGSLIGALVLRAISFNFRIFDIAAAAAAAVRGPRALAAV